MISISFEKKVMMRLLECIEIDLKYVENFINKFEKRYGSNLFDSFINDLKEKIFCFPKKNINGLIRYYLICNVFYEFEKQNKFDFESFCGTGLLLIDNKINFCPLCELVKREKNLEIEADNIIIQELF